MVVKPPYLMYYDGAFVFDAPGVDNGKNNYAACRNKGKLKYMMRRDKNIATSIQRDGLRQPAWVEVTADGTRLHPGQSRCRALRMLGMTTIPAIIVAHSGGVYTGDGDPIEADYAVLLFSDDLRLYVDADGTMRHRCVKAYFEGEPVDPNVRVKGQIK